MRQPQRMSVRAKLAMSFFTIGVLVATTLLTAFQLGNRMQREQAQSAQSGTMHYELLRLKDKLTAQRSETLALMSVTGARQQTMVQSLHKRAEEIDGIIEKFEGRTPLGTEIHTRLGEVVALRNAVRKTREQQIIPFIRQGKTAQAKLLLLGIQQQRVDKLQSLLGDIVATSQHQAMQQQVEASRAAEFAWRTTIIVAVVTLILSAVVAEVAIRNVAHQHRGHAQAA